MTELDKAIEDIEKIVDWYRENPLPPPEYAVRALSIFAHIDVLQRWQSIEERKHDAMVNHLVSEGDTVVASERIANESFPLANELRRRIRTATKVGESLRSYVSYVKSEMQNLER